MKILILNHNQEGLGTWHRCVNYATALAEKNEVFLICASGKAFDFSIRRRTFRNFTIVTLPRFAYGKFFSGQITRLFLMLGIVAFCRFDILYAFALAQPQIAWPTAFAKLIRKKKVVVDWDDLWGDGFGQEHGVVINEVLKWHETNFLRYADGISCCSKFLFERAVSLQKLGKFRSNIKILYSPNGARIKNTQKLRPKKPIYRDTPNVKFTLVSMGNTYTKSVELMIGAVSLLNSQTIDFRLVMIGSAKLPLVSQGLKSPTDFSWLISLGSVPHEEVMYHLFHADGLLLPMDDNDIEKARFPMRLADYLVSGTPIVSNAVGDVKYFLEKYEAGFVSTSNSVLDFAEKINSCVNNKELGRRVVANAQALAENELSNDVISRELTAYVSGVVNGR